MDELDNAIVRFLQQNGRIPFTEISQNLDVSEGTIRNRVSRLLEEGIVRIVGIADPAKMGYSIAAVIAVYIQGVKVVEIAAKIAAVPEVSDVLMVSGEFDLLVQLYCRDSEHLTTFIGNTLRTIPGVTHTQTFVVMKTFKASSNLRPIDGSS
ncbi:MAG: Lrp/AsnC family transcriptional regulator [Chloroflexi bacterium]|nr:Lrp/AsnC family transcriptional regulator [Chloroflexota bacterium]